MPIPVPYDVYLLTSDDLVSRIRIGNLENITPIYVGHSNSKLSFDIFLNETCTYGVLLSTESNESIEILLMISSIIPHITLFFTGLVIFSISIIIILIRRMTGRKQALQK